VRHRIRHQTLALHNKTPQRVCSFLTHVGASVAPLLRAAILICREARGGRKIRYPFMPWPPCRRRCQLWR
jgi:hypothetical protein